MQIQPMLAENFGGLFLFFGGVWLFLCVLCLVGLYAGSRGHWSAILLSAPGILFSGLVTVSLMRGPPGVMPVFWVVAPIPLILGLFAVVVWSARR